LKDPPIPKASDVPEMEQQEPGFDLLRPHAEKSVGLRIRFSVNSRILTQRQPISQNFLFWTLLASNLFHLIHL